MVVLAKKQNHYCGPHKKRSVLCTINLLADFLHFGTSVVFVARRFRAVRSVGRKEWVQCEVWSVKESVGSEKCGVWSLSLEYKAPSVKYEVWTVRFGVWRKQWEVRSAKCGVWSVKFGVRKVQCEVWSVKTLLRLSLKNSNSYWGKDAVGTGCLWTIGHLCLGNFRRQLARVYVIFWFGNILHNTTAFDLEIYFILQRRILFRHLKF